jgi:hypothetical protein
METGAAVGAAAGMGGGGGAGAAGAAGALGAAEGAAGAAARRDSITRNASSRVMRPPTPVPVISDSLMPFSDNNFRTMGESNMASGPAPFPPAATVVAGSTTSAGAAGGGGGAAAGGGKGAGAGGAEAGGGDAAGVGVGAGAASAAGGAAAGASSATTGAAASAGEAPSPITASFTPTSTVSPSGTKISLKIPAAGEGTSESTLSVETSKSGSSRSTWSPTAFIQRVMVPSVTVSPSCGIVTSGKVESPSGQGQHRLAERLGQ